MSGLKANGSFVGDGKIILKERQKGEIKTLGVALFVMILLLTAFIFAVHGNQASHKPSYFGYRVVNVDMGIGYKQPRVCFSSGFFVAAHYNTSGYLNITAVNSQSGNVVSSYTLTADADKYRRPALSSDGVHILVVWRSSSNSSLYGQFLNSTGKPLYTPFKINDTSTTVGATDFDAVGIPSSHIFVVVWSDTSYHNHFRVINDTWPVQMGSVGDVSTDAKSHAKNQIGYDPKTGNVMIVWRRYNSTGIYNVTGRIFSVNWVTLTLLPVTSDFTIGSGIEANTRYDYPSVAGGDGHFFVAYTNYNSPYEIYGRIINASDGDMGSVFQIGTTALYGRSFVGIAYNGSGFTVVWTDSSYDIVARNYDVSGNSTTPIQTIAGTDDKEETQDVAIDVDAKTYYFVWYDYTNHNNYGVLLTENVFIPEIWVIGIIVAPAVIAVVRKRK